MKSLKAWLQDEGNATKVFVAFVVLFTLIVVILLAVGKANEVRSTSPPSGNGSGSGASGIGSGGDGGSCHGRTSFSNICCLKC